jgi:hypothetical protein
MKELSHIGLLGLKAKDVVTGFSGVVSSVSFDLYGCVQAVISPGTDKDGQMQRGEWFDVARIEITDARPVMEVPDFSQGYIAKGRKGCSDKPLP